MPQLKVLICGAGIAGSALAYWLAKLGHDVTVIERYSSLRSTGLQIDLRGPGIEVMKRMGLEQILRAKTVNELGMEVVDSSGKTRAYFPANKTGKGTQSFTSEWEIMRGDLCQVLHDVATDHGAKYIFGTTIESFEDGADSVEVVFSDGKKDTFDLLVGADGQRSRIRKILLGPEEEKKSIDFLGTCIAYFTIQVEDKEEVDYKSTGYIAPGGRWMLVRRHNPHQIQVYLGCDNDQLKNVQKGDVPAEKEAIAKIFRGAGWQTDNLLEAMMETDDFFCEHLGLVKLPSWSSGHVSLVGDAAWCPTPRRGMGTTSGMVGAYILAGEISNHCGRSGSKKDLAAAFKSYDKKFRPFMDHVQRGISSEKGMWTVYLDKFLSSHLGVFIIYGLLTIADFLKLHVMSRFFNGEKTYGWVLPEYDGMVHV